GDDITTHRVAHVVTNAHPLAFLPLPRRSEQRLTLSFWRGKKRTPQHPDGKPPCAGRSRGRCAGLPIIAGEAGYKSTHQEEPEENGASHTRTSERLNYTSGRHFPDLPEERRKAQELASTVYFSRVIRTRGHFRLTTQ